MSPTLLTLVIKQHHEELRWWARCCTHGDNPPLTPRWVARLLGVLATRLRPTPPARPCCA